MEKKSTHGGSRTGAGRRKTTEEIKFNIDQDLLDIITNMLKTEPRKRSRFINEAIREKIEKESTSGSTIIS